MTWYAVLHLPTGPVANPACCTALAVVSPRLACTGDLVTLDLGTGTPSLMLHLAGQAQILSTQPGCQVPTVGVATSRLVAQLAARHTEVGGAQLVASPDQADFLAPLPVTDLPIAPTIAQRLQKLGMRTVGQLARLSRAALQAQFGLVGRDLFHLARGHDLLPFVPDPPTPLLQLARRFVGPVINQAALGLALQRLAAQLCQRLDAGAWAAGALALTLEQDDDPPLLVTRTLAAPTTEQRQIGQHLGGMLRTADLESGVTALRIAVPRLVPLVVEQLALLPPEQSQAERRGELVAALAPRLRTQLVQAALVAPDAHLPEQRVVIRRLVPS